MTPKTTIQKCTACGLDHDVELENLIGCAVGDKRVKGVFECPKTKKSVYICEASNELLCS